MVHLGHGEWIVIDSCRSRASGRAAALEYLQGLGVDVSRAVRLIVVSHFHDDHIRGIASVVREARSAKVVVSAALQQKEFFQFVEASREAHESTGGGEFSQLLDVLKQRREHGTAAPAVSPQWAVSDMRLYQREGVGDVTPAEVWALSPPPAALGLSFQEIARTLPRRGAPQRRAVMLTPNRAAIAVWLSVGNAAVLLGADLEDGGAPTLGWRAVVSSTARPQARAGSFKVAHHGSINGHNADVWDQMLAADAYALVTPYAAGRKFLPSREDVSRRNGLTSRAYCTALPGGWSPRRRGNAVERTLRELAPARRALTGGAVGHLRIRSSALAVAVDPTIELFNGAVKLSDLKE